MAALCLPCTAAVASSAASDSRRINTVYSLPNTYGIASAQALPLPEAGQRSYVKLYARRREGLGPRLRYIYNLVQVPIPYRTDSW